MGKAKELRMIAVEAKVKNVRLSATSEKERGSSSVKRCAALALAFGAALTIPGALDNSPNGSGAAFAGPQGHVVLKGVVNIDPFAPNSWNITASNGAVIQYTSFNLTPAQFVQFFQPSSNSAVLNMIPFSGAPTVIDGTLNAQGVVYFANPDGIIFGNNAVVNVAGIYAAAGNIDPDAFNNFYEFGIVPPGGLDVTGITPSSIVTVESAAQIFSGEGGAVLLGHNVRNFGTIDVSNNGLIQMVANNDTITLVPMGGAGNHFIVTFPVTGGPANPGPDPGVVNTGTLSTGGNISLGASDVYGLAVRLEGHGISGHDIDFHGAGGVQLGADVTITASGDTTFHSTVDGNFNLTVDSPGKLKLGGAVGGGQALSNFTRLGGGDTSIHGGLVRTFNNQSYGLGNLLLGTEPMTFLQSLFGGDITIGGGLDSMPGPSRALTVDSSGLLTLGGAVGANNPLLHIARIGGGNTAINGGLVRTISGQNYGMGSVMLGANTIIEGGFGDITFGGIVDSVGGVHSLTVDSAALLTFGGAVGGSPGGALLSFHRLGGGNTAIHGGLIRTQNGQFFGAGNVTLGTEPVTFLESLAGGEIHFGGLVNSEVGPSRALTVDTSGVLTFTGEVGGVNALLHLARLGGGDTAINGGLVRTVSGQEYGTGQVLIGANTLIEAGFGNVTFGGLVDSAGGTHSLTVDAIAQLTFGGAVGGSPGGALLSFHRLGGGNTAINGGLVRTQNGQFYGAGNVTLGSQPVTFIESTGGGEIHFGGLVDSAAGQNRALVVDTSNLLIFGGAVGSNDALLHFSRLGGGATEVNGGLVQTVSGQSYGSGAVTVGMDTLFNGGVGDITFGGLLNSAGGNHGLEIETSATLTFGGAVGGLSEFQNFNRLGGGNTAINGGLVRTLDGQFYGTGNVTIGSQPVTFIESLAGGEIQFGGMVDSAANENRTLVVDTTNLLTFGSAVGSNDALLHFSRIGGGDTAINGGLVRTVSGQSYGSGAVTIGAATLLDGGVGDISFGGILNSAAGQQHDLSVDTSATLSFAGQVGGNDALLSFTRLGGGATVINGGLIETQNGQSYGTGNVTIGTQAVTFFRSLGGGDIHFGGLVDSVAGQNRTLVADSAGLLTFGGAVGSNDALLHFSRQGGGNTAINGGLVKTVSGQAYGAGNVTLGAAALLDGGMADISFGGLVNSAIGQQHALTTDTSAMVIFGGAVGGIDALQSYERLGGGATAINGGLFKTAGQQNHGSGSVLLGGTTRLEGGSLVTSGLTVEANNNDLTLAFASQTAVNGGAGVGIFRDVANFTSEGSVLFTGNFTTAGFQRYENTATLGTSTTLTSTGNQEIRFFAKVDSDGTARALTVNSGGLLTFDEAVGENSALASLTRLGGGQTQIDGGLVKTTGQQSYGLGTVTLGNATRLEGGSLVTSGLALDADDNNLTIAFDSQTAVNDSIFQNVNDFRSERQVLLTGNFNSRGFQHYEDTVTLGANSALSSTDHKAITFDAAVRSDAQGTPRALSLNTNGAVTFGGTVGQGNALASLTRFGTGTTAINGGLVRTTGNQTYSAGVTLGANTVLETGGLVRLDSTVNSVGGARGLEVTRHNGAGGNVEFRGSVGAGTGGALSRVRVEGETDFNFTGGSGMVRTIGSDGQRYMGAVRLGSHTELRSEGVAIGNVAVDFGSTIDSNGAARDLTVTTGSGGISFGAGIGNNGAMGVITAKVGDDFAANHANVEGGSIITFGKPGNSFVVNAQQVFLNNFAGATPHTVFATVGGHGNLTFNLSSNATAFSMGVGQKMSVLGNLFINAPNGQVFLGDLNTLGNMSVTANTINLLLRAPGGTSVGVDYIAGGAFNFNGSIKHVGTGAPPVFANPSGIAPAGHVGLIFTPVAADFLLNGRVLDLAAKGTSIEDVSNAIAAEIPRRDEESQVAAIPQLRAEQRDQLRLIVDIRDPDDNELRDFIEGRWVLVDADAELRNHHIVSRRLNPQEANEVIEAHAALIDRQTEMIAHVGLAWDLFRDVAGDDVTPEELVAWLIEESQKGELEAAVLALDDLSAMVKYIRLLEATGLTPHETRRNPGIVSAIYGEYRPPNMNVEEYRAAVIRLRSVMGGA